MKIIPCVCSCTMQDRSLLLRLCGVSQGLIKSLCFFILHNSSRRYSVCECKSMKTILNGLSKTSSASWTVDQNGDNCSHSGKEPASPQPRKHGAENNTVRGGQSNGQTLLSMAEKRRVTSLETSVRHSGCIPSQPPQLTAGNTMPACAWAVSRHTDTSNNTMPALAWAVSRHNCSWQHHVCTGLGCVTTQLTPARKPRLRWLGLCHNTLTQIRTPALGMCPNTLT